MAYPPVVAGGTDACTIHYGRNDKVWSQTRQCTVMPCFGCMRCLHLLPACTASPASLMQAPALQRVLDGQLLLMDAGCELNGYVSDVTRTWPVNGRFSSPQQAVYEGVLFAYRCAACSVPSKAALLPCETKS